MNLITLMMFMVGLFLGASIAWVAAIIAITEAEHVTRASIADKELLPNVLRRNPHRVPEYEWMDNT